MAGNSFLKSLKKSKSSKQLTVGLGDGSKGILSLSLSFFESVFKSLIEIILKENEFLSKFTVQSSSSDSSNDILKSISSLLRELTVGSHESAANAFKMLNLSIKTIVGKFSFNRSES
ncbi:hypothetical protein Tco_1041018 [Tanacetum coccineum]|uniref:Uncharacterized protein n=1 Tax=Tanacetum coccineum TaxID=301880 RepID=A0ABQ5GEZ8_9ASTR